MSIEDRVRTILENCQYIEPPLTESELDDVCSQIMSIIKKGEVGVEEVDMFLEEKWNHLFSPEDNFLDRYKLASHLLKVYRITKREK